MLKEGYGILVLKRSRLCISGSRSKLRAVVTPGDGLKESPPPSLMDHDCCSLSGGVGRAMVGVDSRPLTAACQPWSEMEVKLAACSASDCFLFCFL